MVDTKPAYIAPRPTSLFHRLFATTKRKSHLSRLIPRLKRHNRVDVADDDSLWDGDEEEDSQDEGDCVKLRQPMSIFVSLDDESARIYMATLGKLRNTMNMRRSLGIYRLLSNMRGGTEIMTKMARSNLLFREKPQTRSRYLVLLLATPPQYVTHNKHPVYEALHRQRCQFSERTTVFTTVKKDKTYSSYRLQWAKTQFSRDAWDVVSAPVLPHTSRHTPRSSPQRLSFSRSDPQLVARTHGRLDEQDDIPLGLLKMKHPPV